MEIRAIHRMRGSCAKDQVCRRIRKVEDGSLTLECAAVLPLFFIACLTLILFMDAVRIQGSKNLELSNKARQLASAAALAGDSLDGTWIDLRSVGTYRWLISLPGIPKIRYALRARVYPWIGSENGLRDDAGEEEGSGDDELIYITDYQSVYHTDPSCTHLDLAVIRSSTSEIGSLRNAYGKKYRKCSGFPKNYRGPVYASVNGDRYYPSADYGGLTRHVHVVRRGDCEGLELCERCAARSPRGGDGIHEAA